MEIFKDEERLRAHFSGIELVIKFLVPRGTGAGGRTVENKKGIQLAYYCNHCGNYILGIPHFSGNSLDCLHCHQSLQDKNNRYFDSEQAERTEWG